MKKCCVCESPSIVEAMGTRPSQHDFKPRHSTASALLPISARVVSGFKQRKPPSKTIAIAVDISKVFDTVSHRLLIEMIHRFRLCHNLVKWLVAYLRGRKASCSYQLTAQLGFPPGVGGGPTGVCPLPSPLQPFCL